MNAPSTGENQVKNSAGSRGQRVAHDFAQVLHEELNEIVKARKGQIDPIDRGSPASPGAPGSEADALRRSERLDLKGLALSGGGIRSATFSLGVIQAFCEGKVLREFDYLSTVSGGGYIGSWLSAQMLHRFPNGNVADLESVLSPNTSPGGPPKSKEDASIGFLREYSNYLTPRVGLLSTDTLAAISAYVRNLVLIQAIFLASIVVVLSSPRVVFLAAQALLQCAFCLWLPGTLGLVLLSLSVAGIVLNLRADQTSPCAKTAFVLIYVILPGVLAAFLMGIEMVNSGGLVAGWGMGGWVVFFTLFYAAVALVLPAQDRYPAPGQAQHAGVQKIHCRRGRVVPLPKRIAIVIAGSLAGATGGVLLSLMHQGIRAMVHAHGHEQALWFAVSIAPFMILQVFALTIVLHLGLVGRIFDYDVQEWWARYGGWLLAVTVGGGGILTAGIYGSALVLWGDAWLTYLGGPAWLFASLWGVVTGSSKKTDGSSKSCRELGLVIVPYVFIIGLTVILSYGEYRALPVDTAATRVAVPHTADESPAAHAPKPDFAQAVAEVSTQLSRQSVHQVEVGGVKFNTVLVVFFSFLVAGFILAWRVDINLFSLFNFYRNRLTRCYLGASRAVLGKRHPHPFTGFDLDDDVPLSHLAANEKRNFAQRPYHIINTTLNMTSGENLAWQQRKAASFFFSPLYCGFRLPRTMEPDHSRKSFMKTAQYMRGKHTFGPLDDIGPMLGGAVAVSGAAVSPNSGFHTDPGVAFLLTLFNVRLGRWCPNPASPNVPKRSSPEFGGALYLNELFGAADSTSRYVYLSDGGHFDNLGIYELVRRRVSLIVLCDCGEDAPLQFDDLADAIRKCSADFGVDIVIDVDPLRRESSDSPPPFSANHVVEGVIRYPCLEGSAPDAAAFEGKLILIKPTLTREIYACASDLRNYAIVEPAFPQQSTVDQWFNEAQFESYRKLGYLIGRHLLEKPLEDGSMLAGRLQRSADLQAGGAGLSEC
ncbi:patatin-like phospholipase family protein [Paraburkholderia sp. A3BS-1L]|uniref:patatin-like phospholipase family protein n=1 Tax=Paraburkholderia sp. A3BS-1L TaxID=3028375 RepID=UPI003DA87F16